MMKIFLQTIKTDFEKSAAQSALFLCGVKSFLLVNNTWEGSSKVHGRHGGYGGQMWWTGINRGVCVNTPLCYSIV